MPGPGSVQGPRHFSPSSQPQQGGQPQLVDPRARLGNQVLQSLNPSNRNNVPQPGSPRSNRNPGTAPARTAGQTGQLAPGQLAQQQQGARIFDHNLEGEIKAAIVNKNITPEECDAICHMHKNFQRDAYDALITKGGQTCPGFGLPHLLALGKNKTPGVRFDNWNAALDHLKNNPPQRTDAQTFNTYLKVFKEGKNIRDEVYNNLNRLPDQIKSGYISQDAAFNRAAIGNNPNSRQIAEGMKALHNLLETNPGLKDQPWSVVEGHLRASLKMPVSSFEMPKELPPVGTSAKGVSARGASPTGGTSAAKSPTTPKLNDSVRSKLQEYVNNRIITPEQAQNLDSIIKHIYKNFQDGALDLYINGKLSEDQLLAIGKEKPNGTHFKDWNAITNYLNDLDSKKYGDDAWFGRG